VLALAVPQHRTHPNQPPIRPVSMPANASIGPPALTLGAGVRLTGSPLNARRQPIPHRYRDRRQGNLIGLSWFGASPARMKGCWRQRRASSPRAGARPFGLRGLTPVSASNQGSPCDRRLDVAQQPIAIAGSNGLPVFRTPKHSTNSLRIAATTICLGLRRPRDFNRATSATIAGLYRIADIAGM
jgi:hypothetical protein